jgi:hypothetical protein
VFFQDGAAGRASASYWEETSAEDAAAAVALIKVVAGWDESNPIVVDVDARSLEVVMERLDNEWFIHTR